MLWLDRCRIGFQLSCFFIAYSLKFDLVRGLPVARPACRPPLSYFLAQITDLSAGINFVLLAILSFVWGGHEDPAGYTTRRIVITAIVAASRLELGAFLFYRVVSRGKDARFDEMREKFLVRRSCFVSTRRGPIGTLAHSGVVVHACSVSAPHFAVTVLNPMILYGNLRTTSR